MSGKYKGVQAIDYPKAIYVHCAAQTLNQGVKTGLNPGCKTQVTRKKFYSCFNTKQVTRRKLYSVFNTKHETPNKFYPVFNTKPEKNLPVLQVTT